MREKYRQLLEREEKESIRVIVCGAGTVGQEIIKLTKQLGYTVISIEDRAEYSDIALKLGADCAVCKPFDIALSELDERESDYYVVMTREHKFDKVCLTSILKKQKAYVGMMASRNRGAILKSSLIEEGMPADEVEKLHTPIGLDIKAQTPAEIAVSVMAEIIKIKNSNVKRDSFDREILKTIIEGPSDCRMIIATIVDKEGSAPRDVGTRMLVKEDGSKVGSVGGGFIEAEVLQLAAKMFAENISKDTYKTDKNSYEAKLCGGFETIILDMI